MIAKTAYLIIDVPVTAHLSINKISYKIPEDFVLVEGYKATTQGSPVMANGVLLGFLSLSFNSKASNPIFETQLSEKHNNKRRKYGYKKLLEPLTGGTYIEGFYYSASPIIGAYNMKIYLKGKRIFKD